MAPCVFNRLPRSVIPIRYEIEIKPCFLSFRFTGNLSLSVSIEEETSQILLNAKDISVSKATFNGIDVEVIEKREYEQVSFILREPLASALGELRVEYTGIISEKMEGFYRSSYISGEEEHYLLSTHFEATGARQVFPCLDEPEFKSIFDIKLHIPKGKTAISNMPLLSKVEHDENIVVFHFQDTPKMSTYLVAFAVGDLEYTEAVDKNGVLVRVYSRKGLLSEQNQGSFALNVACHSLPFYGEYFGIEYPLPKIDLLAVPNIERLLLANPHTMSPATKEAITTVISHEIAHMWFGNLVTMEWWTDLWLKEGFAAWIEYFCSDHCYPEMDIWTHFSYNRLASALRLDALSSSHPIEVEVSNPNEINEIFDTISYCKGASLINMLHGYLGGSMFRSGLSFYLRKYAYANAVTDDLWFAFASSCGMDVGSLMRPWTLNIGFPVLSVLLVSVNNTSLEVQLSQDQYKLQSKCTRDAKLWPVPISLTCSSKDRKHSFVFKHVLRTTSELVDIPLAWITTTNPDDYVIRANADATGFYHVRYDSKQMNNLVDDMKLGGWSTSSRFVFINDGFALAKAGYISVYDWLILLPTLMENENDYSVWRGVLDGLNTYIKRIIQSSDIPSSLYNSFLLKLVYPVINKLGLIKNCDSLPHNTSMLRSLVLSVAGAGAEDNNIVEEAKRLFEAHRSGEKELPNDLRTEIYTIVVRHGSTDVIQYLMDRYSHTDSPEERHHILLALGAARETNCNGLNNSSSSSSPLSDVLHFCLNPNGPIKDQDRIHGLVACSSWSIPARLATWKSITNEWSRIIELYSGQFLLPSLLEGVLSGFSTKSHISAIKEFFDANPVCCTRTLDQIYETLSINQTVLERDSPLIAKALNTLCSTLN
ncbi:cytosol alanyl aminopeptidase (M01 family) [Schistosoma mansoni]|uniref:cytosol alanyl aminopeptidase (M01 family) n=1 Tax=Schistosoma mansoni TaxID=6183 RepID=UPI00022DC7D4|nr:cytosol alanyl aminopeptidase (M01 family) [Schistosoma mansoni]|eukprot:XP_018649175.1 cytosol alanyl aminopeptidase (M01 family) [Schistosoma mansoni]